MLFIELSYYKQEYGGSRIPSNSFSEYARKASKEINYYTSNRINENNITNEIKDVACEIAEKLFEQESLKEAIKKNSTDSKEIASESLGPRSVSYVNKSSLQSNLVLSSKELNDEIYKIIYKSLAHTGLMFRGLSNE